MKNSTLNLFFLINYILIILYMSLHVGQTNTASIVPLLISSLMLIDITYISSCNIRENKVISLFCGLLTLDSWYILLSFGNSQTESIAFTALSPIIWFVSIKFILMFLFQGSGYKFRNATNVILLLTCIGSLVGLCISNQMFASMYGIQFLASIFCFVIIVGYHWKRVLFILKSEWKSLLSSATIITILFLVYYFATIDIQDHISNFGIYLPTLLFFLSIHNIVQKEHRSVPLSTIFSKIQGILIICSSVITLGLIILSMGGGYEKLLIAVNMMFVFLYICNIVLAQNLKQGKSKIIKGSKYNTALNQLQQEELLKAEFANFLHDDVLQDLLSVKNMMTKVHRPDIQDIIMKTLDRLNNHIREQMQDYHPIILKNLTVKENFQNLIDSTSQSFHRQSLIVSFDCSDNLFLVEPYNMLIYRLLKELLTNVYKHSDGNRAWVTLTQENSIIELSVRDNGTADATCLTLANKTKHKGIASMMEQVNGMDGSVVISNSTPHGICIQITIPMKGDVSYQNFIS